MAVAQVGSTGFSGQSKTSGTSLALSGPTLTVAVDDALIVGYTGDAGTVGTVTPSGTATWAAQSLDHSADNSGNVYAAVVRLVCTGAGTLTDVSVAHSSTTARVGEAAVFRGVGSVDSINTGGTQLSSNVVQAGTTDSGGSAITVPAGDFVFTWLTVEGVSGDWAGSPTGINGLDTPTTDFGVVATVGGGAASNISGRAAWDFSQSTTLNVSNAAVSSSLNSNRDSNGLLVVYAPAATGTTNPLTLSASQAQNALDNPIQVNLRRTLAQAQIAVDHPFGINLRRVISQAQVSSLARSTSMGKSVAQVVLAAFAKGLAFTRIFSSSQGSSSSLSRNALIIRALAQVSVPSSSKLDSCSASATQGQVSTATKGVLHNLTIGQAQAVTIAIRKVFLRVLSAVANPGATIARAGSFLRTLIVASPTAPSVRRMTATTKLAASASTTSASKQTSRSFIVIQSLPISVNRAISRTMTLAQTLNATIQRNVLVGQQTFQKALTAISGSSPLLALRVARTAIVSLMGAAATSRSTTHIGSTIQSSSTATQKTTSHRTVAFQSTLVNIRQFISRKFASVQGLSISIGSGRAFLRTLLATQAQSAIVSKIRIKILELVAGISPTGIVRKLSDRSIRATLASILSTQRSVAKGLLVGQAFDSQTQKDISITSSPVAPLVAKIAMVATVIGEGLHLLRREAGIWVRYKLLRRNGGTWN